MCHELGCLPVSKLCGLPSPSDLLEADGTPKDANHRLLVEQLPELLTQLEWMAVAMKSQRYVGLSVYLSLEQLVLYSRLSLINVANIQNPCREKTGAF